MSDNIYYHGSSHKISQFDYKYTDTNTSNDQYGSGFYFAQKKSLAIGYSLNNSKMGFVHKVILDIKNPLSNEKEQLISKKTIEKIITSAPNILSSLENFGELKTTSKYEKYINGESIDKKSMTREMLIINKRLINEVLDTYYNDEKTNVLELLNLLSTDFFDGEIKAFNEVVHKNLGYDSVEVEFNNHLFLGDNKFIIAWFPEQIKIVEIEKSKLLENQEIKLTKCKLLEKIKQKDLELC